MTNPPFSFSDSDGSTWIRNTDGTFRCLDAEIRSMKYDDIVEEFGLSEET